MKTVGKIVLGIVIAFILIAGGCVAIVGSALDEGSKDTTEEVTGDDETSSGGEDDGRSTVVLEVTSTGSKRANNITWTNPDMNISQDNGVKLPWKKTFKVDDGAILGFTLTAQNAGSGKISCKVTVDGEVESENTSSGQYAVVSCG